MCTCSVSFSLPLIFTLVAASISPFSHRRYKIFVFLFQRNLDCKTVRTSFAYSSTREQSNKRSGTRLKTESETGERR